KLTASGELYFVTTENGSSYLDAMRLDGSGRHRVLTDPIKGAQISPDEQWVAYLSDAGWEARPIAGGQYKCICGLQKLEDNSIRTAACIFKWSHYGKAVLFTFRALQGAAGATVAVPLQPGTNLPPMPPDGVRSMDEVADLPGAVVIPSEG